MLRICAAALVLGAWTSPAPDVVVYSLPSLARTLHGAAARFTERTRVPVHLFVAPPDGLIGLLTHRARADLVVADRPTLDRMAATKLIRGDTEITIGGDAYVLIARADAVLSPAGAVAVLLATHPTVVTDPTTAASFDGRAILATVSHTIPLGVADTPIVVASVRADPRLLGLVRRTEASSDGVHEVAALSIPATPIAAALVTQNQSTQAANLLAFIASPEARPMLHDAGLDPAS